jgi:hypothetical protein
MKLRLKTVVYFFLSFLSVISICCNSTEEQTLSKEDSVCFEYNSNYDDLKEFVSNLNSFDGPPSDALRSIGDRLSTLNKYNCPMKRDLKFVDTAIVQLNKEEEKRQKERADDELTGDDLGMSGVRTSDAKILFDENMNSYVNIKVYNQTKRKLKSLKFGVKYCKAENRNPLCYKFVIIPTDVEPLSSKDLSFDLPKNLEGQTDYPEIKLIEVVKSDGSKVLLWDGYSF